MYPLAKRRFLEALGSGGLLLASNGWARASGRVCAPGLFRRWRFHGGAPLSFGAVVCASGTVAVATHEGYLHALAPDGAFLWSYTVDGALLTGVHLAAADRFVAATSTGKIYSLESDGRPHWVFTAPAVPELVGVDPGKGVLFFTRGRGLYAVSSRAGLLWSLNLRARPVSNLSVDAEGRAWVVTADSKLHRIQTPYFSETFALEFDAREPRLVGFCRAGTLLHVGERLLCLGADGGVRWQRAGVVAAAAVRGGQQVLLALGGELEWVEAASARRASRLALPASSSEVRWSGMTAAKDWVFATSDDGQLLVADRAGKTAQCRLDGGRLFAPVFDAARSQVIVSAGSGMVCAVSLREWA